MKDQSRRKLPKMKGAEWRQLIRGSLFVFSASCGEGGKERDIVGANTTRMRLSFEVR